MKNIKYIILLALLGLIQSSCNNVLETVPTDRLSSNVYWKSDQDAEYASNAAYTFLDGPSAVIGNDELTDFATPTFDRDESKLERDIADTQTGLFQNTWNNLYKGIRCCNEYLANVVKINPQNESLVKQYTAEVRTLRAYYYSKLVAYFGPVPLITEPISIEDSKKLTRTPVSEIYDFIESELNDAANDLPLQSKDKGRITRGAAESILARTMLFAAGNVTGDDNRSKEYLEKSKNAADEVIASGVYSLFDSYKDLFLYANENNSEVIFDVEYIKDYFSNSVMNNFGPVSLGNNGSQLSVTKNLVDEYETVNGKEISDDPTFDPRSPYTNRDPRLSYTIYYPGAELPNGSIYNSIPGSGTLDAIGASYQVATTGLISRKYINKEDIGTSNRSNCGINFVLVRYAEVLLIAAETRIELNEDLAGARSYINEVRARKDVHMPPITVESQDGLRAAVRHERNVELALEGIHYFDLKRWKTAESLCNQKTVYGIQYIDAQDNLITASTDCNKRFTSRDYLWPIPYNERQLNPNLTQNPGWE